MKKHNSHIILESNSSEMHDYEKDENGNIKIDINEDNPYHSFVEQKKKIDIKDILSENNNLLKQEFEKNILSEEMYKLSNKKKKKRKVIRTDLFVKLNDYRFNVNKIQPCFNEIDIEYDEPNFSRETEDRKNLSHDFDENKEKTQKDVTNEMKRNTMYMLNYGKNTKKLKEYKNRENKNKENKIEEYKKNKENKNVKFKNKIDDENKKIDTNKKNENGKELPLLREILEYENNVKKPKKKSLRYSVKEQKNFINEDKKIEEEKYNDKNSKNSEEKIIKEPNEDISLNDKIDNKEEKKKNEEEEKEENVEEKEDEKEEEDNNKIIKSDEISEQNNNSKNINENLLQESINKSSIDDIYNINNINQSPYQEHQENIIKSPFYENQNNMNQSPYQDNQNNIIKSPYFENENNMNQSPYQENENNMNQSQSQENQNNIIKSPYFENQNNLNQSPYQENQNNINKFPYNENQNNDMIEKVKLDDLDNLNQINKNPIYHQPNYIKEKEDEQKYEEKDLSYQKMEEDNENINNDYNMIYNKNINNHNYFEEEENQRNNNRNITEETSKDKFLNEQEISQNTQEEIKNEEIYNYETEPKFNYIPPPNTNLLQNKKYIENNNDNKNENNFDETNTNYKHMQKVENKILKPKNENNIINIKNEMEKGSNNLNSNNIHEEEKIKDDKDQESDIKLLREKIIYDEEEKENPNIIMKNYLESINSEKNDNMNEIPLKNNNQNHLDIENINNEINNEKIINNTHNDINKSNSNKEKDNNKSSQMLNTNINNDIDNEINENKNSNSINETEKDIISNINNANKEEIKNKINPEKNEKEDISETFDKFEKPLEESPLNMSNNTERKIRKKNINEIQLKMKRNSVPNLLKGKKSYHNNLNQNNEKELRIDNAYPNNINPEENKDIQSNNTEATKRNEKKIENFVINSGDNKSINYNSKFKEKNKDIPELDNKEGNEIEENKSENVNDDNNISKQNNINDNSNNENFVNNTKENNNSNYINKNQIDSNIKNDNNNFTSNKPTNDKNINTATNSQNYLNYKLNSYSGLNNNYQYQNEEMYNNLNQINQNPNNIFGNNLSIQNISNIKKNDQLENDDNIPMLIDKMQNDKNDNNNINNNEEINFINIEENGLLEQNVFDVSNGRKLSGRNILLNNNNSNGKIYDFANGNENDLNEDIIQKYNNQGMKGENNFAMSEDEKERVLNNIKNQNLDEEIIKKEKEKEESQNENNNKENIERIDTEEYLENNLLEESQHVDEPQNNLDENNNKSKEILEDDNSSKEEESESKEIKKSKIERIYLKHILPVNYISKIRHDEIKINQLIPKKKRVFITKNTGKKSENEILIPKISLCLMTHQYIIHSQKQMFTPIINKYYFQTKLTKYHKKKNKKFSNKLPKVYKKIVVSPTKNDLFCIKHRNSKYESVINIDKKGSIIDINFLKNKNKNKNEKISLVSKDKNNDEYTSSSQFEDYKNNNKNRNIIIKQNNNVIKRLSDDPSGNIDISIQFNDKTPKGLFNIRTTKRFPVSANKNRKNFRESLYKDLKEINNKINNKDDYLKKHYYNLQYQRHVGDINTCPLCREMRKKGIISEKEKGIHNNLNSRKLKNLNRRPLSNLKISLHQKEKEYQDFNVFSTKNSNHYNNIESEFKNKYLQFNGLNRPKNKLIKYGSTENILYNKNENNNRNFRYLNMNKENEKNLDDNERLMYPSLIHYFRK